MKLSELKKLIENIIDTDGDLIVGVDHCEKDMDNSDIEDVAVENDLRMADGKLALIMVC